MNYKYIGVMNEVVNFYKIFDGYIKKFVFKGRITKIESVCLRIIWQNPGISQLEIAKENYSSKSKVVTYITGLEKKGLVRKKDDDGKKRVYLTKAGKEIIEEVLGSQGEIMERMFKGKTDEEIQEFFSTIISMRQELIELGEEKTSKK